MADSDAAAEREDGRDPVDVYLGQRVKLARNRRHLTQPALAQRIGVSPQQLQKYESAQDRVSASRLKKIADVLRFPVSFFLDAEQTHDTADGLDAQSLEYAETLASIPDTMVRRRLFLFAQAVRDDLAAAELRIRAEVVAELAERTKRKRS